MARQLLGQRLVRLIDGLRTGGIIVETEAYLGVNDAAAHTFGGRNTSRNRTMWGDGGHLYVYFTYGMHHCMNVVASTAGDPVAVLLRAVQPEEGTDVMYARRRRARRDTDLCSGPAKLCQALQVDRSLDGADLVRGSDIWIERGPQAMLPPDRIVAGPRIGVAYAGEWAAKPLRFHVAGNPHVSR